MKSNEIKKSTNQEIPSMVILPASQWEAVQLALKNIQESKNEQSQLLGDWMTEKEAQTLLNRKYTTLWRLRKEGTIKSKKIGSANYYSKKSIIDFLDK